MTILGLYFCVKYLGTPMATGATASALVAPPPPQLRQPQRSEANLSAGTPAQILGRAALEGLCPVIPNTCRGIW